MSVVWTMSEVEIFTPKFIFFFFPSGEGEGGGRKRGERRAVFEAPQKTAFVAVSILVLGVV